MSDTAAQPCGFACVVSDTALFPPRTKTGARSGCLLAHEALAGGRDEATASGKRTRIASRRAMACASGSPST